MATNGDMSQNLRERLSAIAHRYQNGGNLRQAMEMYWTLLEDHPGTSEAQSARLSLLGLAQGYEGGGALREARAIYKRLLRQEEPGR